jgi:peptide/nickel transport system substrate-binding protein
MRHHYFYLALGLMLFTSCGESYDDAGKTIFRYNEAAGITSLDPAFARDLANIWACNQLYDGLVYLDEDLRVKPGIASSWQVSDDGTSYTFFLRNDVFFHDHEIFEGGKGRAVTAADFVYSFSRIIDPAVASPGAWVFNNIADSGIMAINDSVLKIQLKQPFTPFPGLLCMQYCNVVPREVVEHLGRDFRKSPVGCGPFTFKYWKEGVKLVLHKNNAYYMSDSSGVPLPYLDAVAITFLIDKQSAFLQFIQGKIDFMSGIDASYKDELLTPEGRLNPAYADRIYLLSEPYLNTEYLGIMVGNAAADRAIDPLHNRLVRKAISYGFDRVKMMRYLRNNIGIPGRGGIIPAGMPSFDTTLSYGYSYNPLLCDSLLEMAGYPGGEGLPAITLTTSAEYLDLCKYIQHELMLHGIGIEISVSPPAAIKEMKAQAKLPFFRASWIADYPDAENYLSLFYSHNFCPAGPNYTHFSNDEFDRLYEASLATVDENERFAAYRRMDSLIMDEAAVVILYYDEVLRFVRKEVSGLGSNPVNLLDLTHVKKDPEKE